MEKMDQSIIIADTKKFINPVAIAVLVILLFIIILLSIKGIINNSIAFSGFVATLLIASSIKMADQ